MSDTDFVDISGHISFTSHMCPWRHTIFRTLAGYILDTYLTFLLHFFIMFEMFITFLCISKTRVERGCENIDFYMTMINLDMFQYKKWDILIYSIQTWIVNMTHKNVWEIVTIVCYIIGNMWMDFWMDGRTCLNVYETIHAL